MTSSKNVAEIPNHISRRSCVSCGAVEISPPIYHKEGCTEIRVNGFRRVTEKVPLSLRMSDYYKDLYDG